MIISINLDKYQSTDPILNNEKKSRKSAVYFENVPRAILMKRTEGLITMTIPPQPKKLWAFTSWPLRLVN